MKKLLLIRHAKSDWTDSQQTDFDRPLNKRGRRNSPEMAQRLVRRNLRPDLWLSSTAVRARETVRLMLPVIGLSLSDLRFLDELYLASPDEIIRIIRQHGGRADVLFLTGHNPGITDLANMLTPVRLDNMPTCSVFSINLPISDWKELKATHYSPDFFDYPKKLQ
jgi:phosphohistidine phosphatase